MKNSDLIKKYWIILGILIVGMIALSYLIINDSKGNSPGKSAVVKANPEMQKYVGSYLVRVDNQELTADNEMFILSGNAEAKWMLIKVKAGGGYDIISEKAGNWAVSGDLILIRMIGITGPIDETYVLYEGKMRNGSRYLQKME